MVCLFYPSSYALKTYTMIQGLISKVFVKFSNTKKWQFSILIYHHLIQKTITKWTCETV